MLGYEWLTQGLIQAAAGSIRNAISTIRDAICHLRCRQDKSDLGARLGDKYSAGCHITDMANRL